MVKQEKTAVSELQFQCRRCYTLCRWMTNFKTGVCSGSGHPAEAMPWVKEVEVANSVDDLETSRSIFGRQFPNVATVMRGLPLH